jgi:ABC-type arginine/histidine transport system permease subunit
MISGTFKSLELFVKACVIASLIGVPLAIWKLVDTIVWVIRHFVK